MIYYLAKTTGLLIWSLAFAAIALAWVKQEIMMPKYGKELYFFYIAVTAAIALIGLGLMLIPLQEVPCP
jgi:NADH:ubiquinone oxidoreductase subunit K